jgi:hypothetical protein
MAYTPRHVVKKLERHEWIIGDGDGPVTAREFRDGIYFAHMEMEELGIDVSYDDAYEVTADGYEIVISVTKEEKQ